MNAKFAFTLSPFGNGLDCHRTWEALLLGTIPIVMRSSLDPLFEDLPVVIVDQWSEVTAQRLANELDRIAVTRFNFSRLELAYWVAKIKLHALPTRKLMTIDEFTRSNSDP